jgi:hypothetical protein
MMALGISAALATPSFAQGPRANGAQNHPSAKPPAPQRQQQRQAQRQGHQQQQQGARRAQNGRQNSGANRPPNSNASRPGTTQPNVNPNRPPTAYTPPTRKFNELSPQDKQRVLEYNRRLQSLPPAQRQEMQDRARIWGQMTPEQRNHIRNEVIPKWRQLPADRQRAISQRLGVLKNMPESARNQHLNDPNFTRGMSEEDKATLRDLSHMHVGGPPEPPSE